MTNRSLAQPPCTDTDHIIERAERGIARLKARRPHLEGRVERAEHIITVQLSVRNGSRPIRVRVHADGTKSYTVRSGAKLRKMYTVEAGTFRCDCPDATHRLAMCKHGVACFILERAYRSPKYGTCAGCAHRVPNRELFEVLDSLTFFAGGLVCRGCANSTASETV